MELRHLRYFVAVAEELHFGRAAERLYIVQPALSKQIAALEKELGVELFFRTKRHVAMTPAGASLLEDARQVLAQAEGAKLRARLASQGEVGLLEIGFVVPVLYDLLPHMLRVFRASFPDVRLSLHELHSREIVNGLASRDLHIGFSRIPIPHGGESLRVLPLVDEPVLVAMPDRHPLAARGSVALADLADEDLVMITRTEEPELYDAHVSACAAAGFSPKVAHQVDRTHVAVGLVAGGLGMCFVPSSAQLTAHPGVAYRPLTAPSPRLTFGAIWNADAVAPVLHNFLALQPWRGVRSEVAAGDLKPVPSLEPGVA
ncbi:MAG: LysR substrate-binding domain-containing protein [Blastococcus sp.]